MAKCIVTRKGNFKLTLDRSEAETIVALLARVAGKPEAYNILDALAGAGVGSEAFDLIDDDDCSLNNRDGLVIRFA